MQMNWGETFYGEQKKICETGETSLCGTNFLFWVLSFIFISLSCPPLPPRFSWTDAPPHFSLPLSKHGPWEGTRNLQKSFLKSSGSIIATDFKNLRERRSREERLCLLTNSYDLFLLWSTFFFFFQRMQPFLQWKVFVVFFWVSNIKQQHLGLSKRKTKRNWILILPLKEIFRVF